MRNDKLIVDFTEGNIIKQMLTFSLPFMLSNMMQVLYSFVDMANVAAEAIELTCPKVPIPNNATPIPKIANIFASHLFPRPFSI